jgi:predicted nucleic acid-binding protein
VFLRNNHVHRITARIARGAFALVSSLPVPSAITADDAIVAATAIEHSLPLYALDPARFATVPGLAVIRPY